jgi:hypothetical protein
MHMYEYIYNISARTSAVLTEILCDFIRSPQTSVELEPRLG